MVRFDLDTAVARQADGRFTARMDTGWWIVRGPNGGYLAAILLSAIQESVGDAQRAPRSFTIHFLAPPSEGPVTIEVETLRAGRSLTSVSARLLQEGRLMATALAALSKPFDSPTRLQREMPEVLPPEHFARSERPVPINAQYDLRPAVGAPPFSGSSDAISGGWIRLAEPRALDAPLVAAYCDGFSPALFPTLDGRELTRGMPTVDLTVHFRSQLPLVGMKPDDFVLAVFHTHHGTDGFAEEDGEIWSPDGRLIAQSRQLMVML